MVIVADKAAGRVADPVLRPVGALGDFFAMTLDTSVCMFKPPFAWREYLLQCWFVARVSTLPGVLMTIPWAVISGFLFNVLLTDIGAADFSGTGCAIFTVNQSAPIVTVLVVAGAGATAMCADLGARTIREELDALRVMGINPIQALAAPRVLAATTVSLALNSVVTATGLIGAFFWLGVSHARLGGGMGDRAYHADPHRGRRHFDDQGDVVRADGRTDRLL